MANKQEKRNENIEGNFFVDSTCIDCGTCYWVDPNTFKNINGLSAVYQQPTTNLKAAYRALYSCPTNSIGVYKKDEIFKTVLDEFPYEIEKSVFHMGFHSEKSYGAASFLITGEKNYLIDSPRYLKKLTHKIKDLGGLDYQLLTHKDDIADTDQYHENFQSPRYIHQDDQTSKTKHYEYTFSENKIVDLTNELKVIPVPGHTKGSVCFLYKDNYLFTGDHLAYSTELGHLYAFKNACWYDFKQQIKSMEILLDFEFEYVLPGHGSPISMDSKSMKKSLEKCISWMKS